MGAEKKGSKNGGSYVGGFLQLFDWNAKSRKKLFSNKSELPEQYKKHKKNSNANFPVTRLHMMEENETVSRSIINGGSDYSCASSVTDEDFYGTKAPSVVARLMGLDSLPTSSNYAESDSDTQSLGDFRYRSAKIENVFSGSLSEAPGPGPGPGPVQGPATKPMNRPIEKFQSEVLPPKSAKSIPITHHKLLSPIKRGNFVPSKDAAHIMEEAAARILDHGQRERVVVTGKGKIGGGSSSVPLKLRDLKEKAESAQKGGGNTRSAAKLLKGQSMNKSWNGSGDGSSVKTSSDSEECSTSRRNKGKSISLALQAKVNVQKREGMNVNGVKEEPNQVFKSRSSTQKHKQKKSSNSTSTSNSTQGVLRQNNQKQNRLTDIAKAPLKPFSTSSQGKKLTGETSSSLPVRLKSSIKTTTNCEVGGTRRLGSDVSNDKNDKNDKRDSSYSGTKNLTRKKRCIEGDFQVEKNNNMSIGKSTKHIQSDSIVNKQINWPENSKSNSTDIVSFTFSAPMTRSTPGEDYQSKRPLLDNSNLSPFPKRVLGGDALSTLLEQKLRELTITVEASQQKSNTVFPQLMEIEGNAKQMLDYRLPSPISVLESSLFMESCNSSETILSNNSTGGSKQCSSVHAREILGTKRLHSVEATDMDLSDSAASTYTRTLTEQLVNMEEDSKEWELEYVKEILCNVEKMFKDYAMGRARDIINPHLFEQLESRKGAPRENKLKRKLLFDCVRECMELRCKRYVGGGIRTWAKGLSVVRRKERLAEEVYKEVTCWGKMGNCMVDELVDKDMSTQYGKWVDYEVEAFELGLQIENRLLNSLIDEVVADMLLL